MLSGNNLFPLPPSPPLTHYFVFPAPPECWEPWNGWRAWQPRIWRWRWGGAGWWRRPQPGGTLLISFEKSLCSSGPLEDNRSTGTRSSYLEITGSNQKQPLCFIGRTPATPTTLLSRRSNNKLSGPQNLLINSIIYCTALPVHAFSSKAAVLLYLPLNLKCTSLHWNYQDSFNQIFSEHSPELLMNQ